MLNKDVSLLIKKIAHLSERYYESGTSSVSDSEFDSLLEELRAIDPNHPILSKTGWGYVITDGVEHLYHEITGIANKIKNLKDAPELKNGEYWTVLPKLDGASVICYYNNGILQRCVTRGDGTQGRDVTKNLMTRVPLILDLKLTGYIRCEVVITKKNFEKHFPAGRSLRNTATGLMGAKTPELTLIQYLDVIPLCAYSAESNITKRVDDIGWDDLVKKFSAHIKSVLVDGTLRFPKETLTKETMEKLSCGYLCDGLVVNVYNAKHASVKVFAYKFDDEIKTTVVTKVEWVTQDTGKLFPTIHYEPTEISGCIASKASGKSYDYIIQNGIGTGAKITLVRSGEIIPNIHEILERAEPEALRCQHGCDPEYLESDGAHIYCRDPQCPAVALGMFKRLIMAFAPKTFEEGMLNAIMKRFNNNVFNLLETLKRYERKEILQIEVPGLTERGKAMVQEVFKRIMEGRLSLEQLADIAIIESFGHSQSKLIESKASNEKELNTWCKDVVIIPEEFSINSRGTGNWTRRHRVIKEFLEYFTLTLPKRSELKAYKGVVCITGKIEGMKKTKFSELYIESQGYKYTEHFDECTLLIDAEGKESSKIKKAQKKGIKIIPIDLWIKGSD